MKSYNFGETISNKNRNRAKSLKNADLTAEDLDFIGRFATTAASLSTEFLGGIPSIQEERIVLERMMHL